jgi:hypothetical protein
MSAEASYSGNLEQLRVVVFREGNVYSAQCLEIDIATQANHIPELLERLDLTIDAEFALSRELGKKPFEGIAPASTYFHTLWEKRSVSLKHLRCPIAQHFQNVEIALAEAA